MYAIIRSGGKQTKVREGDVIHVERLRASGDEVDFTPILVVDDDGNAISDREALSAITVHARVLGETRGDKIDIFKYKSKSGYRRRQGHRQTYTALEVTGIDLPGTPKKPGKADTAEPEKAAVRESESEPDDTDPGKPAAKPEPAEAAAKPKAAAKPATADEEAVPAAEEADAASPEARSGPAPKKGSGAKVGEDPGDEQSE